MWTKERFDIEWELWGKRGPDLGPRFAVTQNDWELWMFCKFLEDYSSYLEVGGAWGQTIWFAARALTSPKYLATVDLCEPHSGPFLVSIVERINKDICPTVLYKGNSDALHSEIKESFDVVFIDGGHSYEQVVRDYDNYGPKATKAVVFHDFCQEGPHNLLSDIGVDRVWYSNPANGLGYAVKFV